MLKRICTLFIFFAVFALSASAVIINCDISNMWDDEKYYEAYTLSNNTAYNGTREGIHAGWTYDNRAGNLRTVVTAGYGTIRDTSTTESSCLYRDLNKTSEGKVALETTMYYLDGFDGLNMFFNDEDGNTAYSLITVNGSYAVVNADGSYTEFYVPQNLRSTSNIKVFLDFEKMTAKTVMEDKVEFESELLSDNIMRFGFSTSDEEKLSIQPGLTKITANYHLDEEFKFNSGSSKMIPYGWSSDDESLAYIAYEKGHISNGKQMTKAFDAVSGKVAFEAHFFTREGATGNISMTSDGEDAVSFTYDGTNFFLNGTEIYENSEYVKNLWYRFRIEADFNKHSALIYVNGRITGEIKLPEDLLYVDGVRLTASGDGMMFDNLLVHSLIEKDDYVPRPVVPTDSENHIVGINVCSLWSYESTHGWLTISPYEDFRPVLGYYDEGSPEVADWEIKMMVEHGIDFQAFCWYADSNTGPLEYPRNMLQLNEGYMYAKYSDMMNYCLIWEAANCAHPGSPEFFKENYVPYWIEHYFKDDRYLVIDNKPVLLCFGYTRFVSDVGGNENAKECIDYLREELKKIGFDGLILIASHTSDGDHIVKSGADGVCAYNWGTTGKDVDYSIGRIEACANIGKTWTVPTLSTGFNSLPWHGKRHGNMLPSDFEKGLKYMRDEYFEKYPIKESWQDKLYMLSTWNEYGEGTYIMPAEKLYGYGYLEAVRNVFTDGDNPTHMDLIPTENQLARITKNYPQHIRVLRRNDTYVPDIEKNLGTVAEIKFEGKELFKVGGCDNVSYDGSISGTALNNLSYVESADELNLKIDKSSNIKIDMSVSKDTTVTLWYTTNYSPYYTTDKSVSFEVKNGTDVYNLNLAFDDIVLRNVRIMFADSDVDFDIRAISVLNPLRLYIDEKCIESGVFPDTIDGVTYYPFDPREAQGYIMNCHFEWDYAEKKLTIYGTEDRFIEYTVGSDVAVTHDGEVELPAAVYQSDNLPMLYMEILCDVLGFDYEYSSKGLKIKTENYKKHSYIFTHPENEWDFGMGTELGWTADNATMYITDDNELYIKALDGDTRTRTSLNIKADKYIAAEVCLKYKNARSGRDSIGFFFITDTDGTWDELKHAFVSYPSNSSGDEYVTITVNLKDYTNSKGEKPWKGTIESLRFDPFNAKDSECWIKYIKLIPNPDYDDGSVKKEEFTEVFLDAEDGKMPFNAGDTIVTVVNDPINEENSVYMVAPGEGRELGGYLGFNYPMYFEPGAKYKVSYDYLGGKLGADDYETKNTGPIYVDPRYVDPAQANQNNPHDHFNGHDSRIISNGDKWTHYEVEFTVSKDSYDRTSDSLRIYANPISGYSLTYYVDNLKITKVSENGISDVEVNRTSFTDLHISGKTDVLLPGEKSIVVALYDTNGRLYDMELLHLNENSEFSFDYKNAGSVATVKIFTWKGFRTFAPHEEALVFNVKI